jgi:guanylate cyclase
VKQAYKSFLNLGMSPTDTPDERAAKRLFVLAILPGEALALAYGLGLYANGEAQSALLSLAWAAWHLLALLRLQQSRKVQEGLSAAHLALSIAIPLAVGYLAGSFTQTGTLIYALSAPALALVLLPRQAAGFALLYAASAAAALVIEPGTEIRSNLPGWLVSLWLGLNLLGAGATTYLVAAFLLAQQERIRKNLQEEQAKTDRLLSSIFPGKVAAQVKNSLLDESTVPTIAEHFKEASVLFADMVNFTTMSGRLSPRELVNMLSTVFSHFDRLAERRGLEKIKIVGDCYIVAAGLPQPRPDHAQALAALALEIQAFTKSYTFSVYKINFRVGIHTGPLIAGVIGQKKISYDLWGDTVNIASRMASSSPGGGIQITGQTYDLLKDDFICVPRGKVFVKGKGDMETWLLTGKLDS